MPCSCASGSWGGSRRAASSAAQGVHLAGVQPLGRQPEFHLGQQGAQRVQRATWPTQGLRHNTGEPLHHHIGLGLCSLRFRSAFSGAQPWVRRAQNHRPPTTRAGRARSCPQPGPRGKTMPRGQRTQQRLQVVPRHCASTDRLVVGWARRGHVQSRVGQWLTKTSPASSAKSWQWSSELSMMAVLTSASRSAASCSVRCRCQTVKGNVFTRGPA